MHPSTIAHARLSTTAEGSCDHDAAAGIRVSPAACGPAAASARWAAASEVKGLGPGLREGRPGLGRTGRPGERPGEPA
eukprot:3901690-Rhodomonas_salina.4